MSNPDGPADDVRVGDGAEGEVEPTHTTHQKWTAGDSLCVPVVSGVATVTGTEPTALPPLYDAIDLDGLEHLVRSVPDAARPGLSVSFEFAGCAVHLTGTGDVTVRPANVPPADD